MVGISLLTVSPVKGPHSMSIYYLPRTDTNALTPETVSIESALKGKENILLVDDKEQIVRMLQ